MDKNEKQEKRIRGKKQEKKTTLKDKCVDTLSGREVTCVLLLTLNSTKR